MILRCTRPHNNTHLRQQMFFVLQCLAVETRNTAQERIGYPIRFLHDPERKNPAECTVYSTQYSLSRRVDVENKGAPDIDFMCYYDSILHMNDNRVLIIICFYPMKPHLFDELREKRAHFGSVESPLYNSPTSHIVLHFIKLNKI